MYHGERSLSSFFKNYFLEAAATYLACCVLNNKLEFYKDLLIYSSHGLQDDVIPLDLVENYILELSRNNTLTFEKYNSGHTINQRNLLSLIEWLSKTNI